MNPPAQSNVASEDAAAPPTADLVLTILSSWWLFKPLGRKPSHLVFRQFCVILAWFCILLMPVAIWQGAFFLPGEKVGLLDDVANRAHWFFILFVTYSVYKITRGFSDFFSGLEHPQQSYIFHRVEDAKRQELIKIYRGVLSKIDCRQRSLARTVFGTVVYTLVALFSLLLPSLSPPTPEVWSMNPSEWPLLSIAALLWNIFAWGMTGTCGLWVAFHVLLGALRICRRLGTDLAIVPSNPDGAGGLSDLSSISFGIFWGVFSIFPFLLGWIFNVGFDLYMFLGFPVYIVMLLLSFFYPLMSVRRSMKLAQETACDTIASTYNDVHARWMQELESGQHSHFDTLEQMNALDTQYQRAKSMPIWPFDTQSLARLVSLILLPVAAYAMEAFSNRDEFVRLSQEVFDVDFRKERTVYVYGERPASLTVSGKPYVPSSAYPRNATEPNLWAYSVLVSQRIPSDIVVSWSNQETTTHFLLPQEHTELIIEAPN